ncbi:unnamed protein product [Arabis nemorensis]|uniref:Uncharacterized protein n=1 Tax=Arabis nemorensis TaxID=586526 RepID=A0A565AU56_9BRAS|nr:unnamed protein product [Arabis nemorensis]
MIERVQLLAKMSDFLEPKEMALSSMLERSLRIKDMKALYPKFLPQLQSILKRMVQVARSSSTFNFENFKAMYAASLKATQVVMT